MTHRSNLAAIATDAGVSEDMLRDRMEDKGLLTTLGSPTRMAHLTGCVTTLSCGELWDLAALARTSSEEFDPAPPRGGGDRDHGTDAIALHGDETALLASGWTFVQGRDAFEDDLLDALSAAIGAVTVTAKWDGSILHVDTGLTIIRIPADVEGEGGRLLLRSETVVPHDAVGSSSTTADAEPEPIASAATPRQSCNVRSERTAPITDGSQCPLEALASDIVGAPEPAQLHDTRSSAWAAAIAEAAHRGMTATALAYASSLRMNEGVRAALLRGAAPTDHILGAICATLGIGLSFELRKKGTSADPEDYRRPESKSTPNASDTVDRSFEASSRPTDAVPVDRNANPRMDRGSKFADVWAETLRRRRADPRNDTAVAIACGARRNRLGRIMSGDIMPTPSVLLRLAMLYGVGHDLDLDPRRMNGGLRLVDGRVIDVSKPHKTHRDDFTLPTPNLSVSDPLAHDCPTGRFSKADGPDSIATADISDVLAEALAARSHIDSARHEANRLRGELDAVTSRADAAEASVTAARNLLRQVFMVLT